MAKRDDMRWRAALSYAARGCHLSQWVTATIGSPWAAAWLRLGHVRHRILSVHGGYHGGYFLTACGVKIATDGAMVTRFRGSVRNPCRTCAFGPDAPTRGRRRT
jgi:hypothetical protein